MLSSHCAIARSICTWRKLEYKQRMHQLQSKPHLIYGIGHAGTWWSTMVMCCYNQMVGDMQQSHALTSSEKGKQQQEICTKYMCAAHDSCRMQNTGVKALHCWNGKQIGVSLTLPFGSSSLHLWHIWSMGPPEKHSSPIDLLLLCH